MKRMKILFGVIFMLLTTAVLSGTVLGADTYTEGLFTYTVSDCKATVVGCDENAEGDIVIPDKLGGYEVTAIASNTFRRNGGVILNITIPETVTNIGVNCFATSLEGLKFATMESYLAIQDKGTVNMWKYAEKLYIGGKLVTDLVIPDGITSIPEFAFYNYTLITSVTINSPVTIQRNSFDNCVNLNDIYVNSLETWFGCSVAEYAFENEYNLYIAGELVTDLVIPEHIDSIPDYAFRACKSITSVSFHGKMKYIGNYAFKSTNFKKFNVESVAAWIDFCLIEKSAYNKLNFNPATYGAELCLDGEPLRNIVLPESVTQIAPYTFRNGVISLTVTSPIQIHQSAFIGGCKSIYVDCIETWLDSKVDYSSFASVTYNLYIDGELVTDLTIPEGITNINDYAFWGCNSITSITVPESLQTIGQHAFKIPNLKQFHVKSVEAWINTWTTTVAVGKYYEGYHPMCCSKAQFYVGDELLTDLIIPESIQVIDKHTFYNIETISSLTVNSAVSMDSYSFKGCKNMKNIYTDSLDTWLNSKFTRFTFPEKYDLYVGGKLLSQLVIPEHITKIPSHAFVGVKSLKAVKLHSGVTIENDAFYECESFSDVYVESFEPWFNKRDFYKGFHKMINLYVGGELLTEIVIPEGITQIEDYAFANLKSVESVYIPSSLIKSGHDAFINSSSIKNVYVPTIEDWLEIGFYSGTSNPLYYAENFYVNNVSVTEITIPENTVVKAYAFSGFKSLSKVTIPISATVNTKSFIDSGIEELFIGSKNQNAENDFVFKGIDCSEIEKITFGYGIKEIKEKAFYQKGLKEVEFYEGIEKIGKSAFYGNYIKSLNVPSSVKLIEEDAFAYCKSLESVTFGSEVNGVAQTVVDSKAFYYCSSLKNITFNTGVKSIKFTSFSNCSKIENIYINDLLNYLEIEYISDNNYMVNYYAITKYADNIYLNGEILKELVIPEGTTKICDYAFACCKTLETVKLPTTLKYIGQEAFKKCKALREVVFPEGLETIDEFAFESCESIVKIELPRSIQSLGMDAFINCSNLELVIMYNNIVDIGSCAFDNDVIKQILYSGTEEQWQGFLNRNPTANLSGIPVMYGFKTDEFFAPKNLEYTPSSNAVNLKWKAVDGASGYRVYVKNSKTKNWDVVVRTTGRKEYATVRGLEAGTSYIFAVRTYINTGTLIVWSPEYSVIETATIPAAPKKVTTVCKGRNVDLKWTASNGATGYRLFYKAENGWRAAKTTRKTSYAISGHVQGKTYTYAIRSYVKHGGECYWSPTYTKVTFMVPKLDSTNLSVKSVSKGKVSFTWNDVKNETGYQIWYSTSKTGTYKKISNYSANTVSASKSGLKSSGTYYFKIRAYKVTGTGYAYSTFSSAKKVQVK